jgi:hypothetical protein
MMLNSTFVKQTIATLNNLLPGVSVSVEHGEKLAADRIQISPGTVLASKENFASDAIIPAPNWREPTFEELNTLSISGASKTCNSCEFVTVLRLPQEITQHFEFMSVAIAKHNKRSVVDNMFFHPNYRRATDALRRHCLAMGAGENLRLLGHFSNPAGEVAEPSTSIGNHGKYVGLHVDSWNSETMLNRDEGYPTRLCYNLGPEDRYFQFINISVRQIYLLADYECSNDPNVFPQDFFHRHKNYPVVKIRVRPGEAYIAPTEVLIHDGSTVDKSLYDASVTFLGAFTPEVVIKMISHV